MRRRSLISPPHSSTAILPTRDTPRRLPATISRASRWRRVWPRSFAACRPPVRPLFITQRPAGARAGVRHPIGIFVRLRLGIASGFTSEQMAAFRSEKVAGFLGIRTQTGKISRKREDFPQHRHTIRGHHSGSTSTHLPALISCSRQRGTGAFRTPIEAGPQITRRGPLTACSENRSDAAC
jgi:hypothetical protein